MLQSLFQLIILKLWIYPVLFPTAWNYFQFSIWELPEKKNRVIARTSAHSEVIENAMLLYAGLGLWFGRIKS